MLGSCIGVSRGSREMRGVGSGLSWSGRGGDLGSARKEVGVLWVVFCGRDVVAVREGDGGAGL